MNEKDIIKPFDNVKPAKTPQQKAKENNAQDDPSYSVCLQENQNKSFLHSTKKQKQQLI